MRSVVFCISRVRRVRRWRSCAKAWLCRADKPQIQSQIFTPIQLFRKSLNILLIIFLLLLHQCRVFLCFPRQHTADIFACFIRLYFGYVITFQKALNSSHLSISAYYKKYKELYPRQDNGKFAIYFLSAKLLLKQVKF